MFLDLLNWIVQHKSSILLLANLADLAFDLTRCVNTCGTFRTHGTIKSEFHEMSGAMKLPTGLPLEAFASWHIEKVYLFPFLEQNIFTK